MNSKFLKMGLVALVAFPLFAHADDEPVPPTVVNGGSIKFTGEFITAACAVENKSANQEIPLGQYSTTSLKKKGDVTANIPFSIELVDCDNSAYSNVSVAFTGLSKDSVLLDINGDGSNATVATGMAVELLDSTSTPVPLNGQDYSTPQTLYEGNTALHFNARYKAIDDTITSGLANANATFMVKYQ